MALTLGEIFIGEVEMPTGIRHQQVSKWRRRLKEPEKYRAMLFGVAYAKATLWAEWRTGHQLRAVNPGKRGPKGSSDSRNKLDGFLATIESHQLKRDMAYRWIAMSHAPREAVEAYIDTKENSGGPLKRSEVLEIGEVLV